MEILQDRTKATREVRHCSASPFSILTLSELQNLLATSASAVSNDNAINSSLSAADARRRMEEAFRATAERPLFIAEAHAAPQILPHVYTSSSMQQGNILSYTGTKYSLPVGTTRATQDYYEEVTVPPAKAVPPRHNERLILVTELDPLARGSFPGYTNLNRIQSIVFPTAYGSNENMLICGECIDSQGKTDVAMLTVLRVIDQHRDRTSSQPIAGTIAHDGFKIIYVHVFSLLSPMKALAAEIVRKLSKRLQWLSIRVRELTGDMQMTKAEIAETQIIVTTPEKWDVVTRKPTGEGGIASACQAKIKLLIIDEVHLLNEDRGAVIETIVARTLRQASLLVETSQSVIRIVGLSATLPNYIDVAEFLSVSKQTGLFYFDSSFRPIPLEQHFIGVKGRSNTPAPKRNLDRVTFEKVSQLVREGHQVMVFVHARKETVKSAQALREAALIEGNIEDFSCQEHPQFNFFRADIGMSRNKEMKELFDSGIGIHHAGMLRSDRNMMERIFQARAIRVLCCTATLAWGVNLPAHAVIIKGTQVYDSSKGTFVDLSVLDVLQVFGRAGRPGLESSGEGYICTTEDKLTHYLDAVTSQNPIESQFTKGMIDAMNAEIALGTVSNVQEGVTWLGYTYLFVRMSKNPTFYGMSREEVIGNPSLANKRALLVTEAARRLAEAQMINYDMSTESFTITDLGRLAAKYYIRHSSILIFNEAFQPKMTEADALAMLSRSTEFDQIQVRESEAKELEKLMEIAPCTVKDFVLNREGKVNILLQAYISNARIEDFALVSDCAYVAQNGGRIVRALLEMAISRKWANVTAVLIGLSKAIEKRLWPFDQPLKQSHLKAEILYNIQRWADDYTVAELAEMSDVELGETVHLNKMHGKAILEVAKQFPTVRLSYKLRPLGSDLLKIDVCIKRAFNWNSKVHGSVEPFWLWIEDEEGVTILQLAHLLFRQSADHLDASFIIAIPDGQAPPSLTIRFVSDRWIGAEDELAVPLDELVMPRKANGHTARLDLPFLNVKALQYPLLQEALSGRIFRLGAIQTQIFWSIIHSRMHALVAAPVGSGKSTLARLLLWKTLFHLPGDGFALFVLPRKSILNEELAEMKNVSAALGFAINFATASKLLAPTASKEIRLTTPAHIVAAMTRHEATAPILGLSLVVCDNIELLDPLYELGVSLLLHATQTQATRFVGFTASLNDPVDIAAWLNVDAQALYNFRPSDRDQALSIAARPFSIPQSATLFKAMARPAHAVIAKSDAPAVIFVPSRTQCRLIALDLITHCTLETQHADAYLPTHLSAEDLSPYIRRLQDVSLADFLVKGVGFFHRGIEQPDRSLMLQLYSEGTLRVLMVPRDAAWELPVRAAAVVVMGTQYVEIEPETDTWHVRDYSLADIVRMQGRAVRHGAQGQFHLFCQAEDKDTFLRFLEEGLPLESKLIGSKELTAWYAHQRKEGAIGGVTEGVQALNFTFLAKRIVRNPAYYDAAGSRDEFLSRLVDELEGSSQNDTSART
ncbi:Sec63-domain-containing protein [Vararia minispora EC-137]|uniref:Sec63-domain-containing protein n=1 Tax=Vararia minispora EC-137 TaxID=1314806 RepID=A0ACB8QQ23_9AGAM|nr:Sec63-domain-containing protein [Vararia minispora EC-137]